VSTIIDKPTVGFIGIGSMGWPMAALLAKAGYPLFVSDADPARAKQFADEHKVRCVSANAEMARSCRLIVTMLPTSAIVEQVLLSADGFSSGLQPGALIIEMSSGVPAHTQKIAKGLAERSVRLVDAPVSGGVKRAMTGDLAIMVGGAEADVAEALPLLSILGSNVMPTGAVGTAHAMKALNNLVSAAGFVAGVEALLIGKRFGLDTAVMVDVLNASTGMNNSTQKKFKQFVLPGAFNSGFGLDLMLKDIGIALDLARESGTTAPLSSATLQLWEAARNVLGAGHDHTEVALLSAMLAGVKLQD
jgi:3-hydroxyisobutyrate dehydrogenase